MIPDKQESALVQLAKTIEAVPRYVIEQFAVPIIMAIVSEPLTSGLALGSTLLGVVTNNAWIGGATFMLLYTTLRTINAIANAIGISGQRLAGVLQTPPPVPQFPTSQVPHGFPSTGFPSPLPVTETETDPEA